MRLPGFMTRWRRPLAGIALLAVAGVVALTGLTLHLLEVTDMRVRATAQAIGQEGTARRQLRQLLAAFDAATAAERGYLLTGDAALLTQLQAAKQRLNEAVAGLATCPVFSASDRIVVTELAAGIRDTEAEFDHTVALHEAGQPEAAIALVQHGAATTFDNWMRARVGTLIDELTAQRTADQAAHQHAVAVALTIAVGGTVFGALVPAGGQHRGGRSGARASQE